MKALLSLDRQDSNESSASNQQQQQQQLGVWQVFQPGAAEGGIRAPGGSGTAGPASVGEATQPANNNSNNNTRKRRASARLVTLSSIIHVQGIGSGSLFELLMM